MCPLKDQVETKLDPCQVVRPGDMWCPGEVCKVHRGGDLHRDTSSLLHHLVADVEVEVAGIVQEAGTYECYSAWWRICKKKIACVYSECDRLIRPSFLPPFPSVWRLPRWLNKKRFACVAARPVTSPRPRALSIQQKVRFEVSEIPRAQWKVHSACKDLTQATARLVICSCKQVTKEQYWGQQFCQMERNISVRPTKMTRPVKVDLVVPNIPVGTNRNGPFHLIYQPKFPEFWVEWKAPLDKELNKLSGIQTVCDAGYKSVQKKLGSF